jgi:cyclopropane fatty-acyl-phospholipid synthase-like methyltransferase
MTRSITISAKRVGRFYDLMGQFLDGVYGDNIHYGYWDDDSEAATLLEAQQRLNDLLGAKLAVSPGQRVLDVGCGTGGPALRVAHTTGAKVVGITISQWQVEQATTRSVEAGLGEQVRFEHADACELPFADCSFDGALSLETLVHIGDKARALREVFRVLRAGGHLVLSDLTRTSPMTEEQRAIWSGWPVAAALSRDEYAALATDAGFVVAESLDCARQVSPTFEALGEVLRGPAPPQLVEFYGGQMLAQAREGVLALLSVSKECLGYDVLVLRRP